MPDVIGAIHDKWVAMGGASGFGAPLDDERPTYDGTGRTQDFAGGGIISWHPTLGAFAVYGGICQRWLAIGREAFGYPITDESGCPDNRGRFNHFRNVDAPGGPEDASIYWTSQTDAHEIYGGIREYWSSQGWERGPLGYPTAGEHDASCGYKRVQSFEHGQAAWGKGPTVMVPPSYDWNFDITLGGGVPVGGNAHVTFRQDGSYSFSGHLHDSGATEYNVAVAFGIKDNQGILYTFGTSGHVAGTFESGSRNFDWNLPDRDDRVAANWLAFAGATPYIHTQVNMELTNVINSLVGIAGTTLGVVALAV